MAPQTSLGSYHLGSAFGITVAVQTRKPLHAHAMNQFLLMTGQALRFGHIKRVHVTTMALITSDIIHKDMLRMTIGFP
jgi:hypothetical protein